MLKFTSKLRDGVDYYAAMRRQLPYATSVALNRTADAVRQALVQQTQQVFDRPTPYTLECAACGTREQREPRRNHCIS